MLYVYLFIFAGSYALFFVTSWFYVLIVRNQAAMLYRTKGMRDNEISQRLAEDGWKGRSFASRSTLINGSLFGMLVAAVYTASIYAL